MGNYGWEVENETTNSYTKTEYTKFPVGITRIRVVDKMPFMRWAHWFTPAKRYINCPNKGCPICDIRRRQKQNKEPYTYNMTKRYAINVINKETNKLELMETGVTFITDLIDMKETLEKHGKTLLDADIRVKRKGTTQTDTTYRLDLEDPEPLSSAEAKLLVLRIDLEEFYKPHDPEDILKLIEGGKWEEVFQYNNPKDDTEEDIELK